MTIIDVMNDPNIGLDLKQKQILTAWWQAGWEISWEIEWDMTTGMGQIKFTARPPASPNYSVFPRMFGDEQ